MAIDRIAILSFVWGGVCGAALLEKVLFCRQSWTTSSLFSAS